MSKKKVSIGSLLTSGSGIGPKLTPDTTLKDLVKQVPNVSVRFVDKDNWDKRVNNMQRCELCMHYAGMRCRRHSPNGQEGWPAVFPTDWCGDHKMSKGTMAERA